MALVVVLVGWAFVVASLMGFDRGDAPGHVVWPANDPIANWCGPLGASIAYTLFKVLGIGAWVVTLLTGVGILMALCGSKPSHWPLRIVGIAMLGCAAAGLQQILTPQGGHFPGLSGGVIGVVGVQELQARGGALGAFLGVIVMGLIGALVAADEWLAVAFSWTWSWARKTGVPVAKEVGSVAGGAALAAGSVAASATAKAGGGIWSRLREKLVNKKQKRKVRINDLDDVEERPEALERAAATGKKLRKAVATGVEVAALTPEDIAILETSAIQTDETRKATGTEQELEAKPVARKGKAEKSDKSDTSDAAEKAAKGAVPAVRIEKMNAKAAAPAEEIEDDENLPGAPQVFTEYQLRAKVDRLPIFFGANNKTVATDDEIRDLQNVGEETTAEGKQYRFPGLDLLEEPEVNFNAKLEECVREQAGALVAALQQFKIDGTVDSVESGPVITLFHVKLSPGTKVAALEAISKDIARVLKAQNVRIVPNTVGRDTVGIEVPNLHKEKVRLKELMGQTDRYSSMKLPTFLGKDASGEPLIEDLAKMPHMLIAGTTGSGKSVCMNTIIMGFLYTKKPSELKLVLVDPKMVEMSQFKDIPHLMCPVVTEMSKAAAILEWATTKMDERYELLVEAGCRDISAYNDLSWEDLRERMGVKLPEEEAKIPRKLPYMVFIIDELADLMMTNKEVESYIIRIAQKARAVGIHLILATQRPQANVVTGLIKSNMPCRVAFKVASGMDSRIVLDQKGGELLLGHGDMLFISPRSSKLTRAQGTLVDDLEIRRVVRFMRDVAGPSFERQLMQLRSATDQEPAQELASENNSSSSLAAAQEDPLFPRAVEIVLETRRGSVSLLQRRLAIGYTRASRLIDLMGIAGIISDHKGSVARDVLITIDNWQLMKKIASEQGSTLLDTSGPMPTGGPNGSARVDDRVKGIMAGEGAEGEALDEDLFTNAAPDEDEDEEGVEDELDVDSMDEEEVEHAAAAERDAEEEAPFESASLESASIEPTPRRVRTEGTNPAPTAGTPTASKASPARANPQGQPMS